MPPDSHADDPVTSPGSPSNTNRDGGSTDANSPVVPASSQSQKKRKNGPGGRGVANLTPEQLAKKRANDREAQRNIRERTKAQIESLERTIEQLRSQQPYLELQRAIREKEAVEAENADIKRRLATVLQLIQPIIGNTLEGPDSTGASQRHGHTSATSLQAIPRAGFHHDQFMSPVEPLSAASTTYTMPWQAQSNGSPDSQAPPAFAPRPRSPNGQPTLLGMASSIYRITESEHEALNLLRLGEARAGIDPRSAELATRSSSSASFPNISGDSGPSMHAIDESLPLHQRLPLNSGPTCTLDSIVLTFRADIEKQMSQGRPARVALGPEMPDWRYIANPDSIPAGQENYVGALSRFFGQVLSNRMFPDLQKPPEKVGSAYLLYTSMYWSLARDEASFSKVPGWLHPTELQLKVAHGPWVDAMFWPDMRDKVVARPQDFRFDELFVPLTRTVRCNWPYGDETIFDPTAMRGGQWVLSERFLNHILIMENWTMGAEFAKAYPQLVGTYPLKDPP